MHVEEHKPEGGRCNSMWSTVQEKEGKGGAGEGALA